VGAQCVPRDLFAARDEVGHQPELAAFVGPRDHGARLHAGVREDRRLHLAGLDAVPVDLDLAVAPADELERAVGQPAREVAGAVEPLGGAAEGVGHEALGAERGLPQVAARQAVAADAQLADEAGRQQRHRRAQHAQHGVLDGAAQRHGAQVVRQGRGNAVRGREGRALGGAVAVAERQPRQRRLRAPHVGHRERLAAGEEVAQARQVGRVVVDHGVEERGGEPGGVHVVAGDGARQAGAGGHALVMDHAAAAVEQRAPDLEGGRVEGQRRRVQHGAARGEIDVVHAGHQPQDRAVADLDALGRARGARGVHHVGDGFAVDGGRIPCAAICLVGVFVEQQCGVPGGHERVVRLRRQHVVRAGFAEHVGDALGRKVDRHRHVGGTGLQDAEQRHDGGHRAVQQQPHAVAGAHAQALQAMGQLVGAGVELGVAHAQIAFGEGDGVGCG
jgi:hypothetical protein